MINCLIVDDAPVARDILAEYCKLLPYLEVTGSCSDAFQAREKMQQSRIDILFLDINMPLLSGIDLLKTLKNPPQVIFTTAYKEYAADAFDLAACDYLVKPFSVERFIIAVDKALENLRKTAPDNSRKVGPTQQNSLFVRTDGATYKLGHDQILYLEASRNNTKVFAAEEVLLSSVPLSAIETQLPSDLFKRVHRSFIVNSSKITSLQGNRVFINKYEIPLGSSYKADFLRFIGLE